MSKESSVPVITSAQVTATSEASSRRKKYIALMSLRIPALLASAFIYMHTHTILLPLIIIGISVPLPWIAVLIANDRPPQRKISVLNILGITKYHPPTPPPSRHSHASADNKIRPVVIDVE